jgi:enamine deaminase RidA (YjgF/YER057c/UK114 family)
MPDVNTRLAALGIDLPAASSPAANYVSFVRTGSLVHISGQVSRTPGETVLGTVGADLTLDEGVRAARLCGLNLVSQMREACGGDLDRVVRVVKLGGSIQSGPELEQLPLVMNGCSDLMVEVFGDAGRHARTTVGVYRLPGGVAVEVDAVVEVRD